MHTRLVELKFIAYCLFLQFLILPNAKPEKISLLYILEIKCLLH